MEDKFDYSGFDYTGAVAELEAIAKKVEDPGTSLDDIGAYISRSDELIGRCRQYLRCAREKAEGLDKDR